MTTPVYASDPQRHPDSEFIPGGSRHLVGGNHGRLLDARRTPVTVVDVAPERGSFTVRVDAFEDVGACWELGLEEVEHLQFPRGAPTATDGRLAELRDSRARFDRELSIDCDPAARDAALRRLSQCRAEVGEWLGRRRNRPNVDLAERIARREGHPALYALVDDFLSEHELDDLEHGFCASFVTNPRAGEIVKGHAIVLAELGLYPYRGQAPRDPNLFTGSWSRPRRASHLLWRLALTHELWRHLGSRELVLYRAAATDGTWVASRPATFVSATFSSAVAEAQFTGGPTTRAAVLWRQRVPTERALMTFLETRAMSRRFHEAEAILLADPSNQAF